MGRVTRAERTVNASPTRDQSDTLDEIRAMVVEVRDLLARQTRTKEYYSVGEAADYLGKAEFTVREYCRMKRINAEKRRSGRGSSAEWVISHAELLRIEKEGLLPLRIKH
jgi:hypothetical protein